MDNKMIGSPRKALLIAALSLAVAVLLLGYSSYGWFTISKTIRAIGESIEILAPSGLEISKTGNDGDWHDSVIVNLLDAVRTNPGYNTASDGFYLMPASSYTGINRTLWQTDKISGTITDTSQFASANLKEATVVTWRTNTRANEGYYIDVPLYFRTLGETDLHLRLNQDSDIINLSGTGNVQNTVRVAFLKPNGSAPSIGSEPLVYALDGAASPDRTATVISGVAAPPLLLKAPVYIKDDLSTDLLVLQGAEYSSSDTTFYKQSLLVRIWVEGQDSQCVATIGSKTFSIKLVFSEAEEP